MDIADSDEEIARHPRSIVHLDVDCFYAQIEMLRHPEFEGKPLGVRQKNLVVTCNYIARRFGVGKCMSVQEALRLCPGLCLVRGEDLTEYRKISARIAEILQRFTPLVERLGMDESFVDVSSLVDRYQADERDDDCTMKDGGSYEDEDGESRQVVGNIFGPTEEECPCGCHARLATASKIAADMRARIYKELRLTCSAGIGHNKLLAKLAGSLNKPDQQTLVYPCSGPALLTEIGPVSKIPGVGFKTTQLLATNDVKTVEDVRRISLDELEAKIGGDLAKKLKDLAEGIDDSIIKPSGKPQSIGLEDGFKHVSLVAEVESRLGALLRRLTDLATEDGRMPVAMKITVRKQDFNKSNAGGKRETRQCALPQNLLPTTRGGSYDHTKLLSLALKLFHRAVDVSKPFHLTLLGVAFTKFEERVSGRSSITSFLRKQVAVQSVLDISSEEGIADLGATSTAIVVPTARGSSITAESSEGEEPRREETNEHSPLVGRSRDVSPSSSISDVTAEERYYRHHRNRHRHDHRPRNQSQEDEDSPGEVEPSPKKTKLEVWLSGRRESPSNEMASLRLGPSSPMSPVSPPPGTDPAVFKSLPIDLQAEIGRSWPSTGKPKSNDILKYFIANK